MKLNLDLHGTPITRTKMTDAYRSSMITFLKLHHPEATEEELATFVSKIQQSKVQELWNNLQDDKNHIEEYRQLVIDKSIPILVMQDMANRKFKNDKERDECNRSITAEYVNKFTEETSVSQLKYVLKMTQVEGVDCDRKTWPTLKVIKAVDPHKPNSKELSYGNLVEFPEMDMLEFCNDYRDKIISPFGSVYETTDKKTSFLTNKIIKDGDKRKRFKKCMLHARKIVDVAGTSAYNNLQASVKRNMNSTSGAMGCNGNFLSSPANYNSITSIARFFIMNAYAHGERFLESNFYFRTIEQVLNFITTCVKLSPNDQKILDVCHRHSLHLPDAEEVYSWLINNLRKYYFGEDTKIIHDSLLHVSPAKLAFMFYMSNLYNIMQTNSDYWKTWVNDILHLDKVDFSREYNLDDVNKLDGDLVIVLSTIYNDLLPKNKKDNNISLYDCLSPQPEQGVPEAHPEVVQKFIAIGKHMTDMLTGIEEMFDIFMNHKVGIGYIVEHKHMYRNAIVLSDTDSIIFTTKSWVQWYTGSLAITEDAFAINALIVFLLTKATVCLQYRVSEAFNAVGKDLLTMAMKNEFMMPIEILTYAKKHYCSILKIQEGVVFNKPRLDIKGVGLRGSTYSSCTREYTNWFISSLIDELCTKGSVDPKEKIREVLRYERMVRDDLKAGNTTFLAIESVKNPDEYADPNRSIYFNYTAWEQIFAGKYGSIMIPTKTYVVDVKGVANPKYKAYLDKKSPEIANRLEVFLQGLKKGKELNSIPINNNLDKIPEELLCITDIHGIVYKQTKPMYIILRSLGIALGSDPDTETVLFSDVYGWISSAEGSLAKEHAGM